MQTQRVAQAPRRCRGIRVGRVARFWLGVLLIPVLPGLGWASSIDFSIGSGGEIAISGPGTTGTDIFGDGAGLLGTAISTPDPATYFSLGGVWSFTITGVSADFDPADDGPFRIDSVWKPVVLGSTVPVVTSHVGLLSGYLNVGDWVLNNNSPSGTTYTFLEITGATGLFAFASTTDPDTDGLFEVTGGAGAMAFSPVVPEPATVVLYLVGLVSLLIVRRSAGGVVAVRGPLSRG